MPVVRIDGPGDWRVADYRHVTDTELLRSRGLFIAEGRLVVERLIAEGRYSVRSLLVSQAAYRALTPTLTSLSSDVPIYVCASDDFLGITGVDLHRGCLAMAARPAGSQFVDLLPGVGTIVVLEGVTNADNVGGVFRNAAAFGAGAVLLSPTCCDPLYRKAIRTSMAATLRVPFARLDAWPEDLAELRAHGFTIVALTPRDSSDTLDALVAEGRPPRLALLVGTEGAGLTDVVEAGADRRVRIPVSADVDSLNLAVAVGIALSRIGRALTF